MITFDVIKKNIKKHNTNWQQIFDSYWVLIIGDSGCGEKR